MADEAQTPKLRLFIAITLPDDVKAAIEQTQAELRRALPSPAFRWTKREQLHLTLKFLGYVERPRVDDLVAALQTACRPFPSLPLSAERLGFFPGASRPRVLWVGIHGPGENLISLQQAIESAVTPFTSEEPEKRFKGHVTLARVKEISRSEAQTLKGVADLYLGRSFGNWTARGVDLIQSTLSPAGSRYTTLVSAPLLGGVS